MARKGAKKSVDKNGEQTMPETPKSTAPPPKLPPPQTKSSSNSSLWMMIFLISAGCGVGFFFFFEEMREANRDLAMQLKELKSEISGLSKLQDGMPDVSGVIQSLPEIKETINSMQIENSKTSDFLQTVSESVIAIRRDFDATSEKVESIEKSKDDVHKVVVELDKKIAELQTSSENFAKESLSDIEGSVSAMQSNLDGSNKKIETLTSAIAENNLKSKEIDDKIASSVEKSMTLLRETLSVAETNIEGLANDISRISASGQSEKDKVSSVQENMKSMQIGLAKLESKSQQNEESVTGKFSHYEDNSRKFEQELSEKIALLETTSAQQLSDIMVQLVEAKRLSEGLKSSSKEAEEGLKAELFAALKNVVTEVQHTKDVAHKMIAKQREVEVKLENMETKSIDDEAFNEIRNEMSRLGAQVKDYGSFDVELEQVSKRVGTEIATLTGHVKASKEQMSLMRDDVAAINEAVDQIRKKLAEGKATPGNAPDQ